VRSPRRPDALGRWGEQAAARFLTAQGFDVTADVHLGRGQLDAVACRGNVLAFIEVKTRRSLACGPAVDAVTADKRRRLRRLARLWLAREGSAGPGVVRFDVVAITVDSTGCRLHWLRDAFSDGP